MKLTELCDQLRAIEDGLKTRPELRVTSLVCRVAGDICIIIDGLPREMYMGKPAEVLAEVMMAILAKGERQEKSLGDSLLNLATIEARCLAEQAQLDADTEASG